jgi:hypothetical protein
VPEALTFKPQVSIAFWKDENMHEFVSVAIATPAGLTKKDGNDEKLACFLPECGSLDKERTGLPRVFW